MAQNKTRVSKRAGAKTTSTNAVCVYDLTVFDEKSVPEMRAIFSKIAKKYCFQQERGEKTGRLHYQCRISLKVKKRLSECIKLLRTHGLEQFQDSITSTANKDNDFYVMKEDTRVDGPFTDVNEVYVPRDIAKIEQLRPWQDSLRKSLSEYDERTIDVLYEPTGNIGKSTFTRYLQIYDDAELLPFCNDYKDIMRMAYDVGPKKIYLIDMPRAINKEKLYQFFSAIETLKSGYCYDDRYKFQKRLFDRPRICLFTNVMPDLSLLSRDMWKIWEVSEDHKLVSVELEDDDFIDNI